MCTLTTNNKCQHWDLIHATASVLNMYVVHDLGVLDAYTACTVHKLDSVVVKHKKTNYTCVTARVLYSI